MASSLFDVEPFRSETRRVVVARDVGGPTLVLGSTQRADLVDAAALRAGGVELTRRRGGGGAVSLAPGAQLWLDVWIPRHDPLWVGDVSKAAEWVGSWWVEALAGLGRLGPERRERLEVHRGRALPGELGALVCFAGRGPGEVFHGGRKLVGVSQWRARQGALFSTCAYLRWEPAALADLLGPGQGGRAALVDRLQPMGVGLADLEPPPAIGMAHVQAALEASLPSFTVTGPPAT